MPLIELKNISKYYGDGETRVKALSDVSLSIESGEFVAITGTSGSGKSTLMNMLGCLDAGNSGEYRLDGVSVWNMPESGLSRIRNREIGFIFQSFNLIPSLTAKENVELPLIYKGIKKRVREELAEHALERVLLKDRRNHRPAELSGGQRQRVAIARAIAAKPPIILADEPTGNLDSVCGAEVMRILYDLNGQGKTVIIITHDADAASKAGRVISVADGEIVSDSSLNNALITKKIKKY